MAPSLLRPLVSSLGLVTLALVSTVGEARAQQSGYGQTLGTPSQERNLLDGGSGSGSKGSIFDATNPIDLMNKLRRATAMDEATPPGSAIDQALRDFEAQSAPAASAPPASGASSLMKGP